MFSKKTKKMGYFKVYLIYFLTLLFLGFFGLKIIAFGAFDYFCLLLLVICALSAIMVKTSYSQLIRLYVLFVFISCIYSNIYNHQSFTQVVGHSYSYFSLLFFFVLIKANLPSNKLLIVMEWLALSFCICYIVQWLIYPTILFPSVEFNSNKEEYRGRMPGSICCYFLLLYSVNKYLLSKEKLKYFIYGIIGFVPIIVQGFRTLVVLSVVSAILIIPFVLRNVRAVLYYSLLSAVISVAILNTSIVQTKLDEMIQRHNNDQTFKNDDYIRWLSLDYYWNQQFTHPYEKVFGGGKPVDSKTHYTKSINVARNNFYFFWTDLGIVGLSMIIGIPAVLLLVIMYLRCIYRCKEPQIQFVRFTLFVVLVGSFTTAELFRDGNILLLSLFLYFEHKYHHEHKSEISADLKRKKLNQLKIKLAQMNDFPSR